MQKILQKLKCAQESSSFQGSRRFLGQHVLLGRWRHTKSASLIQNLIKRLEKENWEASKSPWNKMNGL